MRARSVGIGVVALLVMAGAGGGLLYVGYLVGGRVGFLHGFAMGSQSHLVSQAANTVTTLELIRQNDIPNAISALELQVDTGIMAYWAYMRTGKSEFDYTDVATPSQRMMRYVASHRREHPTPRDPELDDTIQEVVATVLDAPDTSSRH